jgi:hypothetical protein
VDRGELDDAAAGERPDADEKRRGGFDGGARTPVPPGRPPSDATADEILAYYGDNVMAMQWELERRRRDDHRRGLAEMLAGDRQSESGSLETPPASSDLSKKTRTKKPDPLPADLIKDKLEPKLRERIAVQDERRKVPSNLTQEAIVRTVGEPFNRQRVQQAEKLLRLGWPLLRSVDSEISALSADSALSAVRWPSVEEAAEILAFERIPASERDG